MYNISRRLALKATLSSAAGLASLLLPSSSHIAHAKSRMVDKIGLQLYTVRDQMELSVENTLATVSNIGYQEVEFAGYFDYSATALKRLLDQNGLTSPSTHISLSQARDDIDALIEYANIVGHKYIIIGFLEPNERHTLDDYKKCAEIFNIADEKFKSANIQFGYHHYDFEFAKIDGQVPYELFLSQTNIDMQIDLYWMIKAGVDMTKYYKIYPGRFSMCHIKDIDVDGNYEDLGKGKINFTELLEHRELAGFKHYFVENGTPRDSLETIRIGYDFVRSL